MIQPQQNPQLSRKQREIAEREALILEVGRAMLLERGYLGLTMDRIAEATEYSKGTIYQHFRNKEELLAALAIQTADRRTELFERGATYPGRPRERMLGIGMAAHIFHHLHRDHFRCEQVIKSASIRSKTSPQRQAALNAAEDRCMGITAGIIRDAVAQGDLTLPRGLVPESITFGLWTMTWGAYEVLSCDIPLGDKGIADPYHTLYLNQLALLDGHGWQPLSSDWDYGETWRQLAASVFPEEMDQLPTQGI